MNLKRFLFITTIMLAMFSSTAFAQNGTVTGRVTDVKNGTPLVKATVTVKGTNISTTTATDGTFTLNDVPATAKTLVISYVGYTPQTVAIGAGSLDISLAADNALESEVVVVAYGTRKRGDLTGAVSSVSAKDFQKGNVASPDQLLVGKVPGLAITSGGGSAGGGSTIRIRGVSSLNASQDPLIVIDGVEVAGNSLGNSALNLLNTINPNDIESISVLKDASAAALYGSRASGGVIIITTKKGTKGKIKFNYNTQFSVGQVVKEEKVLSGDQLRSIVDADAAATGINTYKNMLGTANTDWQKQIYQKALGYNNNFSASGAVGRIPFRASLGYLTQEGVVRTDQFDRLSTALNLSPKFFHDDLSVNVNAKYSNNHNRYADGNAVGAAVNFDPTQQIHQTNNYGGYYEWLNGSGIPLNTNGGSVQPNPLSLLYLRNHTGIVNRLIGNVQLDYRLHFFPDLHVLVNTGLDNADNNEQDNQANNLVTTIQSSGGNITYSGNRYHFEQRARNEFADVSLFYNKDLKSIHSKIDVLALHGYQTFTTYNYTNPNYGTTAGGQDSVISSPITNPTDKPQNRIESYLGRVNYSYKDRYLLTASIRADKSSRFGPDIRTGYFPAVAVAWKLKDDFFKTSNVVSALKIRAGWGQTGNQDLPVNYYYQPNYYRSENGAAEYQFGNTFYSFLRPTAYNPNLTWETTTTYNLGLDYGFLKDRITGSADIYDKKTKNLLADVAVAPGSNFDIQEYENIGSMESKGVEFSINTIPVQTKDLVWQIGFNVAHNESKITSLGNQSQFEVGGIQGGTGNTIGVYKVGYDPSSFLVRKQVYAASGAPIEGLYADLNRDGDNSNDLFIFKKANPTVSFGINTQVTYKQFSLGLAAHGELGNYLYNNYAANHGYLKGAGGIENTTGFIQNGSANYLTTRFNTPQLLSNYYVQNASFLRLDNINFGYNVGKIIHKHANLSLMASVQNVFVITKYTGLDPENSDANGIDNNIYPRPRVYTLGVNLDFN